MHGTIYADWLLASLQAGAQAQRMFMLMFSRRQEQLPRKPCGTASQLCLDRW